MTRPGKMLGVVLAGGLSQRMARDKAVVNVEGEPLWRRQMGVLGAAGMGRVVMVRRPFQNAPAGVECWRDLVPDIGPLSGLHAALLPMAADWVAILAVDMPGIGPDWFTWLAGECLPGVGAMGQHADACEPLAAIYPAEALWDVVTQIQSQDYSLQRLAHLLAKAGRMKLLPLGAEEAQRVQSINTASHLRAWETVNAAAPAFSRRPPAR